MLYYSAVDSTNNAAVTHLPSSADGAVIVADYQTAGRGRLGRHWLAASGSSLLFTVALAEAEPRWVVPMSAGLAVVDALSLHGAEAQLKWPNDVLMAEHKCAGILIEGRRIDNMDWLLLGIGLNVRSADPSLATATYVDAHSERPIVREDLFVDLLARLEWWLGRAEVDPALVREAWSTKLRTLGEHVSVTTPTGTILGLAEDVAADGALILRLADGSRTVIRAGDVLPA
jgi:BirA family biotin operon repressor/biotin-[acetyl-CoA-carboxylase] ligase